MARASLDDDDAWEDDFQTPHTPVHHVVWRENDGHGEAVKGRTESSRESPGLQTGFQVDIGEEEAMLETVNPTWRTTRWLQLVVQGISDDEVPWYEFVIPLMVGTEAWPCHWLSTSSQYGDGVSRFKGGMFARLL